MTVNTGDIVGIWVTILSQLTGTTGGVGTCHLDHSQTVTSQEMYSITGDHNLNLFDKTQPDKIWTIFGCYVNKHDANGGVTSSAIHMRAWLGVSSLLSGVYPYGATTFFDPNLGLSTVGGDMFGAAGTIRDWELTAGSIKHCLRCSVSTDAATWTVGSQTPVGFWTNNVP